VAAIDLNADLGEGVTDDVGLLAVVSSANVACGYHAGDARVMAAVCRAAAVRGGVPQELLEPVQVAADAGAGEERDLVDRTHAGTSPTCSATMPPASVR